MALAAARATNGPRSGTTTATPSSLKLMWATATRRASAADPTDAVSAVTQVPMLAPRTKGTAPESGRSPWAASAMTTPMVAADEATKALTAAPTAMPRIGVAANTSSASVTSELRLSGSMPSIISFSPRKSRPKPKSACPRLLSRGRRFTKKRIAKPRATTSGA